ncbi:MAG: kinase [Eubacterium sp.]
MIITKTPFRVSFFGGGTDFPEYYNENGGQVLSTSIDKYCYVTVRHLQPFFNYKNELVYSVTERVKEVDEIQHPAIREAMKWLDMHELRVVYDADLPARSGLGTSSSFAVGMLNAFYSLKGKYVDKKKLAEDAIYLERVLCNESGGVQDQIAAAFGGLNKIIFDANGFKVTPIIISKERKHQLNSNLMMFFTGYSRMSSEVQMVHRQVIGNKTKELREICSLVDEAEKILISSTSLNEFGKLLDYTWQIKRGISNKVSNAAIDDLYMKAKKAGALGGKLLGAGNGGFMLFYVDDEKKPIVRETLRDFMEVPFEFDNDGTRVLYYAPEEFVPKK